MKKSALSVVVPVILGELGYVIAGNINSLFPSEIVITLISGLVEEPIKRAIGSVSKFSIIIFSLAENLYYANIYPEDSWIFLYRTLITTPLHWVSATRKSLLVAVMIHLLFNNMNHNGLPNILPISFVYTILLLDFVRNRRKKCLQASMLRN